MTELGVGPVSGSVASHQVAQTVEVTLPQNRPTKIICDMATQTEEDTSTQTTNPQETTRLDPASMAFLQDLILALSRVTNVQQADPKIITSKVVKIAKKHCNIGLEPPKETTKRRNSKGPKTNNNG